MGTPASNPRASASEARGDFDALYNALKNGDLATAQGAFQKVQAGLASGSSAAAGPNQSSRPQPNDFLTYLGALGKNLVGDDNSAAQLLLEQLIHDLLAAQHLHPGPIGTAPDGSVDSAASAVTGVSGDATGGGPAAGASGAT